MEHAPSTDVRSRLAVRLRAVFVIAAAGLAVIGWIALGTTSAFADEFTVGIVLDPSYTRPAAFMRGFQLAVDQSPDVSHPSGVEGGDHLGSMDVHMAVRASAREPDEFVTATLRLIDGQGVPIIVADVAPTALAALMEPITDAETLLITISHAGTVDVPEAPFFFAASESAGTEALLTDHMLPFEDVFVAAYGRRPSAAAVRGYIAGRLVDIGVEATDRDPFDDLTLAAALVAATLVPATELVGQCGTEDNNRASCPSPQD
jgi:hypothetical protein